MGRGEAAHEAQADEAAAVHHDPAFEFNAPQFYDFQRLTDNVASPPSAGEDYFESSQTKGLRTPLREEEEEQDEDAQRLQEDIKRVREEMLAAEAAAASEDEAHAATPDEPEPMEEDPASPATAPKGDAGSPGLAAQQEPSPVPHLAAAEADAGKSESAAADEAAKAADRAAASERPKLPPPNLVTSWGPLAPARRILAGSAASLPQPPAPAASAAAQPGPAPAGAPKDAKPLPVRRSPLTRAAAAAAAAQAAAAGAAAPPAAPAQQPLAQRSANAARSGVPPETARARKPRPLPQPRSPSLGTLARKRAAATMQASLLPSLRAHHPAVERTHACADVNAAACRPYRNSKITRVQEGGGMGGSLPQQRGAGAGEAAAAPGNWQRQQQAQASARALTRPRSPNLHTAKRQRTSAQDGGAPMEQEEWRPLALMVAQFEAATPARFNRAGPRAVQYVPPPLPLGPDARPKARSPACRPASGPSAAPRLETDGRLRPTAFMPREEAEAAEMAARPPFRARPLDAAVMASHGELGVKPVPPRPVTRSQTPKLATKARAAAHPPQQEEIPPPPHRRAQWAPGQLTQPHSPKLSTSMRTRSKSLAVRPEDAAAFVFRAQPASDQDAGSCAAAKVARSRRHTATSVRPFHLSTDERGDFKRAATEVQSAAQGSAVTGPPRFHAAPVPATLHAPERLPPVPEKAPTRAAPFRLASQARHQAAVAQREAQQRQEKQRAARSAAFRAAPAPKHAPPRPPRPSERPLTAAQTPNLALKSRSAARAAFDAAVAERQRQQEEERVAQAAKRAQEEAEEVKEYRRHLGFKALPLPEQDSYAPPRLGPPKVTLGLSPALQTRSRARRVT